MFVVTVLLPFLKQHWRKLVIPAAVALAFLVGRVSAPKPTVHTVTQVQWKDRIVTVERKAEAKTETKTVVVYRDRVVHKDGSSEEKTKEVETEGDTDNTTDRTNQVATHEGTQTQTVTVKRDAPRWDLGASVGVPVNLRHPLDVAPYGLADVSYRFWGPLSVELWGMSPFQHWAPTGGLALRMDLVF